MANQKAKCFNILAIDDEPAVLKTLELVARENGLKLTGVGSLEEAQELISAGKVFHGFIFDVVCNIHKDQPITSPKFLEAALNYVKKEFPEYPRAIMTGHSNHYDNLGTYLEENIFEKTGSATNEMFQFIRLKIENLRETKIKEKYSDVWKIFDLKLLASDIENELLETLMQMDNHNLTTIKDNLARIRRIYESIYIAISKENSDIILEDCREQKVSGIVRQIEVGLIIEKFSFTIWKVASDNGSHAPYENPDYMPTKYTVQSLTYALLDVLLWMKSILTKSK